MDLDLVRRTLGGDERAFEEIVRRYSPRVFRIASRFFRQPSVVEDISQDVFLKIYADLSSYIGRGSFEGWISRIATNTCLNALRKSKVRKESPVADLSSEDNGLLEGLAAGRSIQIAADAERAAAAADLAEKVLSVMPAEDRMVLMLVDGEEKPLKEIAETTGWSQSKIKVRAMRARRKMRNLVQELMKSKDGNSK